MHRRSVIPADLLNYITYYIDLSHRDICRGKMLDNIELFSTLDGAISDRLNHNAEIIIHKQQSRNRVKWNFVLITIYVSGTEWNEPRRYLIREFHLLQKFKYLSKLRRYRYQRYQAQANERGTRVYLVGYYCRTESIRALFFGSKTRTVNYRKR